MEYIGWYDLDSKEDGFIKLSNEPYYVEMRGEYFAFIHKHQAKAYLTDTDFQVQEILSSPAVERYLAHEDWNKCAPSWDFSGTIFPYSEKIEKNGKIEEKPVGLYFAKNGEDSAELLYPSEAVFTYYKSIDEDEMFLSYYYPQHQKEGKPPVLINSILNTETGEETFLPTKGFYYKKFIDSKNGNIYFTDGYYHIPSKRFIPVSIECDDSGYIVAQNNKAYYFRGDRLFIYDFLEEKEIMTSYQMPSKLDPAQQRLLWVKPDGSQIAFGCASPLCNELYLLEPSELS